jgi:hypothetical protein
MKKTDGSLPALLCTIFLLFAGCSEKSNSFRKVEQQFGVKLKKNSWINTLIKEQWNYNGDGYYTALFQTTDEKI